MLSILAKSEILPFGKELKFDKVFLSDCFYRDAGLKDIFFYLSHILSMKSLFRLYC